MTEQQTKQWIKEFAEQDKTWYANEVLFSKAINYEDLIAKETNAAVYRYIAELPDRLWEYIKTKLPKD